MRIHGSVPVKKLLSYILTGWLSAIPVFGQEMEWRTLDLRVGIPGAYVHAVLMQDQYGRLWYGTERGLFVYDGHATTGFTTDIEDPTLLQEGNVQALMEDREGRIWVGLTSAGVAIYHPLTHSFRRILPARFGGPLPVSRIWGFIQEEEVDIMWIASEEGLVRYDYGKERFELFTPDFSSQPPSLQDNYKIIRAIIPHPNDPNKIIAGTGAGIWEFNKTTGKFTNLEMPYSAQAELGWLTPQYLIISMAIEGDSLLWATTWAGGLVAHHLHTGEWARYRLSDEPDPYDIGYNLTQRNGREYWYANHRGFFLFDSSTKSFEEVHPHQPDSLSLKRGIFYDIKVLRNGSIAVCSSNGVSISSNQFDQAKNLVQSRPYLVDIGSRSSELEVYDSSVMFKQFVGFNPEPGVIAFTAAYPEYFNPGAIRYRFRLDGHDAQWIESGSGTITYENLPGGRYHLHYQASPDGVIWFEGLTSPVIRIPVLFWKHPLFIGLSALIVVGGAWVLHTYRIRQIQRDKEKEADFAKRLAAMEMSLLRAQMNPHFMFNAINSIKNYVLKSRSDEASRYLTKFSRLMRFVLQNTRGNLISLKEELEALSLYIELEALRFENEFVWQIRVDPELSDEDIYLPPLLIQPYVENAIRHGLLEKTTGQRNLMVDVCKAADESLEVIVEDNGIGREQSVWRQKQRMRNPSYGMQITRDRVALLNDTLGISASVTVEDLKDADGHAAGTRIRIRMPRILPGDLRQMSVSEFQTPV